MVARFQVDAPHSQFSDDLPKNAGHSLIAAIADVWYINWRKGPLILWEAFLCLRFYHLPPKLLLHIPQHCRIFKGERVSTAEVLLEFFCPD